MSVEEDVLVDEAGVSMAEAGALKVEASVL